MERSHRRKRTAAPNEWSRASQRAALVQAGKCCKKEKEKGKRSKYNQLLMQERVTHAPRRTAIIRLRRREGQWKQQNRKLWTRKNGAGLWWHGMAWFIREQGPRKGQSVLPAGRGGVSCVSVRSTEYRVRSTSEAIITEQRCFFENRLQGCKAGDYTGTWNT